MLLDKNNLSKNIFYYQESNLSNYIKNLLSETPLPKYKTIQAGDYISKGIYYIYKCSVIKCIKSGIFLKDAVTKTLKHFTFGQYDNEISNKFKSIYSYYDPDTHKILGDYLRHYRDYTGIDLLPFYNCYCGEVVQDLDITYTNNQKWSLFETASTTKLIKIPIKLNTDYTIALDSNSTVTITGALLYEDKLMTSTLNKEQVDITNQYIIQSCTKQYSNLQFLKPIKFKIDSSIFDEYIEELLARNELNYLYMLIKVPLDNDSSIAVLEGDYTNKTQYHFDYSAIPNLIDKELNKFLLSNLSLLSINNNCNYPFSDVLVAYLLGNVICYDEELEENVDRIQDKIIPYNVKGIFDKEYRNTIYQKYLSDKRNTISDLNGFVDKNVETFIRR